MHNVGYQFKACSADKVWCKKEKIKCLNTCGGSDGAQYKHDFATIVSSTELSKFVLGDGFDSQAAADCTVRQFTFKVPIFKGGDSFATYVARIRVRSGMTAIDKQFCENNALSCGVIQNVLEKSPGLIFVNGAFRHRTSIVPPSPPPDPSPPPRAFAYAPDPPLPPPPPGTPPPFYQDAEQCLPLPRLSDYGLDITTDAIDGAQTEERASCIFARRVLGTFEPLTSHATSTRQNSCAPSSAPTPYPELDNTLGRREAPRERLFCPHRLPPAAVRIAHSNHNPFTQPHNHTTTQPHTHTHTHTHREPVHFFCSYRPPPVRIAHDTAAASSLWRQRERLGDLEKYEAPRKTDVAQWADDTASAIQQTDALIDALGENNPILRDMLATAKQEIYTASTDNAAFDEEAAAAYAAATSGDTTTTTTTNTAAASAGGGGGGYGRRLMQRNEYNVRMTDELITAEIMEFYGSGGIPGVTQASCESLCEATAQLDNAHPDAICRAFAHKRAAPFSYVDRTGWCYLLKVCPLAYRHHAIALLTPTLACSERGRVQD